MRGKAELPELPRGKWGLAILSIEYDPKMDVDDIDFFGDYR